MRGGNQDYMEILVPLCSGVAPVMDDPVNVSARGAGWAATGVVSQHAPSSPSSCCDECKSDKGSLICTEKAKLGAYLSSFCCLSWRNNLITGSVSAVITVLTGIAY